MHTDLPPGPNPRHPISCKHNIASNVTNFHVHTAVSFSVIPILWQMGRSLSIDLPNLADFAIMRNLKDKF